MIVDASALLAILKGEPGQLVFATALARSPHTQISPVNWYEAAVNAERTGDYDVLETFMTRARITVAPMDDAHAKLAFLAFRTYGKGRHPASLNLGDCFAYALAKATGEPLLYKGNDFAQTDIVSALA